MNHILHPLGDRTLCEPDQPDGSAVHTSTDPELASCSSCVRAYEQQEGLRVSLGLTSHRREELRRRAVKAVETGQHIEPDSALSLTPAEVLTLFSEAEQSPEPALSIGIVQSRPKQGHWEAGPVRSDGPSGPDHPAIPKLSPPATASFGAALKPDYNYSFSTSDVEIDRQAKESPHGWIVAREDGRRAECGGTIRSCGQCRREQDLLDAGDGPWNVVEIEQEERVELETTGSSSNPIEQALSLLQEALPHLEATSLPHRLLVVLNDELQAQLSSAKSEGGTKYPVGDNDLLPTNMKDAETP